MPKVSHTVLTIVTATALAAAGCSAPSSGPVGSEPGAMVLGSAYEPESLHPLLGYGEDGASKIFDGLVDHDANREIVPELAAEVPEPSSDGRTWTVKLREGVTFHDGSAFGADDVVATYRAVLDPRYASTISSHYSMIESVRQLDPRTVRFTLAYPYAPLPHRMTLGIVPSERLAQPAPLEQSPLNTEPIGTGPYRVVEWRKGEQMRWEAFERYWDGAPAVPAVSVVFVTDDNTRAQRQRAGDFDGSVLSPRLAQTFAGAENYTVHHHRSADYRTITMPSRDPVTGDPAIRLALNRAVNRQAMIDGLFDGRGQPASTPIPPVLSDYVAPDAQYGFDRAAANRILEQAGWAMGPDGTRGRDGVAARFTLMYPADDSVRRDLAQAFTSDARAVGVTVDLEGLGWEAIRPRMGQDAVVFGGGTPFDPDLRIYPLLHSSFGGDGYNNPGYYSDPEVDAALEAGRRSTDPVARVAAYQEFQRAYVENPGMVFLVFLDHSYVMSDGWTGYEPVVEPHVHGTSWGPWWNLEEWKPQ